MIAVVKIILGSGSYIEQSHICCARFIGFAIMKGLSQVTLEMKTKRVYNRLERNL